MRRVSTISARFLYLYELSFDLLLRKNSKSQTFMRNHRGLRSNCWRPLLPEDSITRNTSRAMILKTGLTWKPLTTHLHAAALRTLSKNTLASSTWVSPGVSNFSRAASGRLWRIARSNFSSVLRSRESAPAGWDWKEFYLCLSRCWGQSRLVSIVIPNDVEIEQLWLILLPDFIVHWGWWSLLDSCLLNIKNIRYYL